MGEGFFGTGLEVAPSGPGGGRRRGVDADLGEEALLFGVEGGVAGALQVQPFAEAVAGGGKAAGGLERAVGFGVIAGLVPGALPQGAPWRVPPRVQRVDGGGLVGGHTGVAGAQVGQPPAQRVIRQSVFLGDGQMSVPLVVGTGVRKASLEGAFGLEAVAAQPFHRPHFRLAAGGALSRWGQEVAERAGPVW